MWRAWLITLLFSFPLSAQMVFLKPPEQFNPKFEIATCYLKYQDKILYAKRVSTSPWPYTWSLPGGAIDPGETPFEAMVREVFEEVGLGISLEEIVPLGAAYVRDPKADFIEHMFVCELKGLPDTITLSPIEHTEYVWISPQEAIDTLELIPGEDEAVQIFMEYSRCH